MRRSTTIFCTPLNTVKFVFPDKFNRREICHVIIFNNNLIEHIYAILKKSVVFSSPTWLQKYIHVVLLSLTSSRNGICFNSWINQKKKSHLTFLKFYANYVSIWYIQVPAPILVSCSEIQDIFGFKVYSHGTSATTSKMTSPQRSMLQWFICCHRTHCFP